LGIKPQKIGVGKGPGSLTGIRVGKAMALSLAFGWDVPLFEFCTAQTFFPQEEGPFATLIDARMQGIYALFGVISEGIPLWEGEVALYSEEDLKKNLDTKRRLVSPHPHLIEKRLQRVCLEVNPSFPLL
jgi:tRNA A37 threonylcarbamoyladenosine modification protein TsaB